MLAAQARAGHRPWTGRGRLERLPAPSAAPRTTTRREYSKMRAPASATRAQVDVGLQAAAPSRSRRSGRTMLTRSMAARAQLAGSAAGDRLLPAVESSVAAAVRALRQAQARSGEAARATLVCAQPAAQAIAVPTDTLYGLAASATTSAAIRVRLPATR